MINNFDLFKFEWREGYFYFFQIIKRKKDNPDTPGINGNNHARCIKEYTIHTPEELEKRKEEMIAIATVCNARIYLHPSKRKTDDIRKLMCLLIGQNIAEGKHNISGLYRHACGLDNGSDKLWIVDIDDDKGIPGGMIQESIRSCLPNVGTDKIVQILPTKNGIHFITTPFNLKTFHDMHPTIDVHKNNPTVMYIP